MKITKVAHKFLRKKKKKKESSYAIPIFFFPLLICSLSTVFESNNPIIDVVDIKFSIQME